LNYLLYRLRGAGTVIMQTMNSCASNVIYSSMTLTDALTEEESGSHEDEGSVFDENDLLDSSTVDPVAVQLVVSGTYFLS